MLTLSQNFVFAEPVKDVRGLEITFPFPDQSHLYASKVCLFPLCHSCADALYSPGNTSRTS